MMVFDILVILNGYFFLHQIVLVIAYFTLKVIIFALHFLKGFFRLLALLLFRYGLFGEGGKFGLEELDSFF